MCPSGVWGGMEPETDYEKQELWRRDISAFRKAARDHYVVIGGGVAVTIIAGIGAVALGANGWIASFAVVCACIAIASFLAFRDQRRSVEKALSVNEQEAGKFILQVRIWFDRISSAKDFRSWISLPLIDGNTVRQIYKNSLEPLRVSVFEARQLLDDTRGQELHGAWLAYKKVDAEGSPFRSSQEMLNALRKMMACFKPPSLSEPQTSTSEKPPAA